jgi:hypothetical protein
LVCAPWPLAGQIWFSRSGDKLFYYQPQNQGKVSLETVAVPGMGADASAGDGKAKQQAGGEAKGGSGGGETKSGAAGSAGSAGAGAGAASSIPDAPLLYRPDVESKGAPAAPPLATLQRESKLLAAYPSTVRMRE